MVPQLSRAFGSPRFVNGEFFFVCVGSTPPCRGALRGVMLGGCWWGMYSCHRIGKGQLHKGEPPARPGARKPPAGPRWRRGRAAARATANLWHTHF